MERIFCGVTGCNIYSVDKDTSRVNVVTHECVKAVKDYISLFNSFKREGKHLLQFDDNETLALYDKTKYKLISIEECDCMEDDLK